MVSGVRVRQKAVEWSERSNEDADRFIELHFRIFLNTIKSMRRAAHRIHRPAWD